MLQEQPPPGEDSGDDASKPWDASLAVLSRRLEEVREAERDASVKLISTAAANWRSGRCAQRTLIILDEWVRRLDCVDGTLACGTYSGEVVLVDIESGDVLETWLSADEPLGDDGPMSDLDDAETPPEITAIALAADGKHVLAGDAAGRVALRARGVPEALFEVKHARPVSGVHYDVGANRVYSSSLDGTLLCHDATSGRQCGAVALRQPILALSVSGEYCAIGLGDGSVAVCTLSPLRQILGFTAHDGACSSVHMLSGSQIVTGGADERVKLWRLDEDESSGRRCTVFEGHSGPVRSRARLAVGTARHRLELTCARVL